MQKDFEQWITVMIRQKELEMNPAAKAPNGALTDKKVQDNLKEFYKARDAIYNET
jgi:hypothetical protein